MNAPGIGEPVGVGRTAVVSAFGPDRVVKILRPGFGTEALDREERLTAAAVAAGAPAPAVHGIVDVDGERGLVLDRIDGELLSDDLALDPMRYRQWARTLASTHIEILGTTSTDLPARNDVLAERIGSAELPRSQRTAVLDILAKAPDGDAVLHGDFHPGNVLTTMRGAVAIDWIDAARGHASCDIARTEWLLTAGAAPGEGLNRRVVERLRKGFVKHYLHRVTRSLRIDRRVVDAWRLPIMAARLDEGVESEEGFIRSELQRILG